MDMLQILQWWADDNQEIAELRNDFEADVVHSLVQIERGSPSGAVIGIAWVPPKPLDRLYAQSEKSFIGVSATDGLGIRPELFAHEAGHNLGFLHDHASGEYDNIILPYAYGHYHLGRYRTIFAYSTACDQQPCPRAPYYSNPDVSYDGLPTGVADYADNARAGSLTGGVIAAYRTRIGSGDVDDDGSSTFADAWTIAKYLDQPVGSRQLAGAIVEGDIDGDGIIADADITKSLECQVGLSNSHCP